MALTAKKHAVQAQFWAVRARGLPCTARRIPIRDDKLIDGELAARRAIDLIDKQVGRGQPSRL